MKSILALLIFHLQFFIFHRAFSQVSLVKQWDNRYGGTAWEDLFDFHQTTDGGYILGGYSLSGIGGDKTQANWGYSDYWIIKTDALGNKQWDLRFGGTDDDYLLALEQTTDGGYMLGGYSYSGVGGNKTQIGRGGSDYWIVKIDAAGNYQWDKRFGGTADEYLYALQQTADGGFILGGVSLSGIGGDKTQVGWGKDDYWIVKIDAAGNYQWDKCFGGTNDDALFSLRQTTDGGYLLGGSSFSDASGSRSQPSWGYDDYWIIKTDASGIKQWDRRFGSTSYDDLYDLIQATDGGYVLAGYSASGIGGDKTQGNHGVGDYWMVKVDASGNKQWDQTFGGKSDENAIGNIIQTPDNGYIIAGVSYSAIGGDKSENNLGPEQGWIIKTDSLGNKLWDKTIFTPGTDKICYIVQSKDGCYTTASISDGGIGGYKSVLNQGDYDYWVLKVCDTSVSIPVSSFISSDSAFCSEPINCISFYDQSFNNPTNWQWSFPGALPSSSNQQNPTNICYNTPGIYDVILIVCNAAGSDTLIASYMITVGTIPPSPVITKSTDTLFCSHASYYQWYFNGVPIVGATDSFYVAKSIGTYNVEITDDIGCSRLGNSVLASIDGLEAFSSGVDVYPNPAEDKVTVHGFQFTIGAIIEIYNVLGEKVFKRQLETRNKKQEVVIDVSSFSKGLYVIQLNSGNKSYRAKFIKN